MLKELYLKNMAVIDEERLEFKQGFQVLTGETGAGKSILVDAMGLVLGGRAKVQIIRDGTQTAIIEAVFDLSDAPHIVSILKEASFENTDDPQELIIKRHIALNGKHKVFVNHQSATLNFLQQLTRQLIDFTGQLEQTKLLDTNNDIHILDAFLDTPEVKNNYQELFEKTKTLHHKIKDLKSQAQNKAQRLDWLQFQHKEFDSLKITTSQDEEDIRQQRRVIKNADTIKSFVNNFEKHLGDHTLNQIKNIQESIEAKAVLKEIYGSFSERINDIFIQIEDLTFDMTKAVKYDRSFMEADLNAIEEKLFCLETLKRKYGPNIEDVVGQKQNIEEEIAAIESCDDNLDKWQEQLKTHLQELSLLAQKVTDQRNLAKDKLEKAIKKELQFLNMPQVVFKVKIDTNNHNNLFDSFLASGCDRITFLLTTNPGLSLRPLAQIASGGETSRIFLALKNVMAKSGRAQTFIFDEIDTGISGAAGALVGQKLKSLATQYQVFCVTHNAQIASLADDHYLVQKKASKNSTITRVNKLTEDKRVQEVARLMGGVTVTEKNLAFAKEMLQVKE
ncbi:MAG: DNA repair protein RecN [bacterium]|nr:DNA repair protein RecN [bacterium]MBU1917051.1 DNA repair protein RecN [bacterium]